MCPHLGIDCFAMRQLECSDNFEIPADIIESWNQAVKSRSRAAKNAVFQAFLRSGKDWSKLLGDHDFGTRGVNMHMSQIPPILGPIQTIVMKHL